MPSKLIQIAALAALLATSAYGAARSPLIDAQWPVYGSNSAGQRFSPLSQITRANVSSLREVWRLETGPGGLQTSPLAIDGVIYAARPDQSAIAIDGASGKELWRYASGTPSMQPARGLSYRMDGKEKRLFATASQSLVALDPETGKPISSFGADGKIDLRPGVKF